MKKRIIAILLSFSILCGSLTFSKRSHAVAAGTFIFSVGWELIGLMTGRYDDAIDAIRNDMGHFEDYFLSHDSAVFGHTDSQFVQDWRAGWENICDWLTMKIDIGDFEIINDQIKLSYEQYLEAYRLLVDVVSKPSVDFQSEYPSFFFSVDGMPADFPIGSLPTVSYLFTDFPGESYALCYYNDEQLVFSDYFILIHDDDAGHRFFGLYNLSKNFVDNSIGGVNTSNNLFENPDNCFSFLSLSYACNNYFVGNGFDFREYNSYNCFVYSNGTVTYTPISEVDLTGFKHGLVSTVSDYGAFLESLNSFSVTGSAIVGESISDLSDVLPEEENPSLSFPLNPDLDKPIADQVIVGDVAGAEDLPLSDYMSNAINIDLVAPPVILTKFPFCIPYDFVRFLGVLAADPIPPVFRIPISTHPQNLEQWADNETIGDLVSPDDPMFEIDEEIVLDFAHIPLVQPICYTVFIVGFVFLLLHVTTKFIQH